MAAHASRQTETGTNGYAVAAVILGVVSFIAPAAFIPTLLATVLAKVGWARSGAGANLINIAYALVALAFLRVLIVTVYAA